MELKNFLTNAVQLLLKESLEQEFTEIAKSTQINGRILTPQEAEELQKEIEQNYIKPEDNVFAKRKNDIRQTLYSLENPFAQKTLNGVDLRITEGLIKNGRKTYLLYADGKIIGEFDSVNDIKTLVKKLEEKIKSGT